MVSHRIHLIPTKGLEKAGVDSEYGDRDISESSSVFSY